MLIKNHYFFFFSVVKMYPAINPKMKPMARLDSPILIKTAESMIIARFPFGFHPIEGTIDALFVQVCYHLAMFGGGPTTCAKPATRADPCMMPSIEQIGFHLRSCCFSRWTILLAHLHVKHQIVP
jgi:hypothetical protein